MDQKGKKKNSEVNGNSTETRTIPEPIPKCRRCKILCFSPFNFLDCGHLLCTICYKINVVDPTWESSSSASPEKRVDLQLQVKCKYDRCNHFAKREDLEDHEKICRYFEAACIHKGCGWTGDPKELFDHFRSNHPVDLKIDTENRKAIFIPLTIDIMIFHVHIEMIHDRVFFVEFIIDPVMDTVAYIATNFAFFNPEKFKLIFEYDTDEKENNSVVLSFFTTDNLAKTTGFHCKPTDLKHDQFMGDYEISVVKR